MNFMPGFDWLERLTLPSVFVRSLCVFRLTRSHVEPNLSSPSPVPVEHHHASRSKHQRNEETPRDMVTTTAGWT